MARLATVMAEALRDRGADDVAARLAAEVGVLAFAAAYERWAAPGSQPPFTDIARAALRDLRARAAAIAAPPDPPAART